jgi:uncharacterized membrane protein YjfL (UPF0719 family)
MEDIFSVKALVGSLVYSLIGLAVYVVGFIALDKLTPGEMWDEIINKKNGALATVVGCALIGISIIIATAIHG